MRALNTVKHTGMRIMTFAICYVLVWVTASRNNSLLLRSYGRRYRTGPYGSHDVCCALLGGQATGKLAPKLLSGSQNRAAATIRFVLQGASEKIRCQLSLVVRKQIAMEMADHEAHARHSEVQTKLVSKSACSKCVLARTSQFVNASLFNPASNTS